MKRASDPKICYTQCDTIFMRNAQHLVRFRESLAAKHVKAPDNIIFSTNYIFVTKEGKNKGKPVGTEFTVAFLCQQKHIFQDS